MSWIDIGSLNDIPLRGARTIKTRLGCVAIFRTDENEVFAASDRCPHKSGPLSDGIVHGKHVTCPLHNWVFSLETGQAQGNEQGQITIFPVRVQDGRILLDDTLLAKRAAA